jgi:hypothetical protein
MFWGVKTRANTTHRSGMSTFSYSKPLYYYSCSLQFLQNCHTLCQTVYMPTYVMYQKIYIFKGKNEMLTLTFRHTLSVRTLDLQEIILIYVKHTNSPRQFNVLQCIHFVCVCDKFSLENNMGVITVITVYRVKLSLCMAWRHVVGADAAQLINISNRWRWVVSSKPWLLYPKEKESLVFTE